MPRTKTDPGKVLYSVSIGLIVLGLLLGFVILPRALAPADAAAVGKEAPDFTLPVVLNALPEGASPEGAPEGVKGGASTVSLSALRGHPVLLDFWATWCGPCRAEAPLVDRVARRYRDRGLVVVGVNTSDEEGLAAPWAQRNGISFPIAFDQGNRAARAYGVENLPTLVVVSKTGKVLAVRTGVTDDAELERLVTQAL